MSLSCKKHQINFLSPSFPRAGIPAVVPSRWQCVVTSTPSLPLASTAAPHRASAFPLVMEITWYFTASSFPPSFVYSSHCSITLQNLGHMTGPPRVDKTGSVVLDYVDGDKCTANGVEKKYTTSVTLACSEEEVRVCRHSFLIHVIGTH